MGGSIGGAPSKVEGLPLEHDNHSAQSTTGCRDLSYALGLLIGVACHLHGWLVFFGASIPVFLCLTKKENYKESHLWGGPQKMNLSAISKAQDTFTQIAWFWGGKHLREWEPRTNQPKFVNMGVPMVLVGVHHLWRGTPRYYGWTKSCTILQTWLKLLLVGIYR